MRIHNIGLSLAFGYLSLLSQANDDYGGAALSPLQRGISTKLYLILPFQRDFQI